METRQGTVRRGMVVAALSFMDDGNALL
jgi:hypothetical protein